MAELLKVERTIDGYKLYWGANILSKPFDNCTLSVTCYPYHPQLGADQIQLLPYQEYVNDVSWNRRSSYQPMTNNSDKIFGLILGSTIAIGFAIWAPSELISVESIVSVFGAYTVGKELWRDIDNLLARKTANWRWRWLPHNRLLERQQFGTLQKYWQFARNFRYGSPTKLANQIDLVVHSNSKTVELTFGRDSMPIAGGMILQLQFKPEDWKLVESAGCFLGFKLSFMRGRVWQTQSELFQAMHQGKIGTTRDDEWQPGLHLVRNTAQFGRTKLYLNQTYQAGEVIDSPN